MSDEKLNTELEPVAWCLAYDDPNLKARIHSNPSMCEKELSLHAEKCDGSVTVAPLYALPPDAAAVIAAKDAEIAELRLINKKMLREEDRFSVIREQEVEITQLREQLAAMKGGEA